MTFGQKTVVIVEDEPDTAEMFIEMMRLAGYQVYNSYAGAPAIALIANKKPDAVILDIMMPDLSGLEVMKYMQRDPSLADIPVVVVSAKTLPTDIQAGLSAGAVNYLTKPVTFSELKEAIFDAIQANSQKTGTRGEG
jgi:CheY-like chemotaxis protein